MPQKNFISLRLKKPFRGLDQSYKVALASMRLELGISSITELDEATPAILAEVARGTSMAEVARAYDLNPQTESDWKRTMNGSAPAKANGDASAASGPEPVKSHTAAENPKAVQPVKTNDRD